MRYDPVKHHRHSIRLKDYDYTQACAYFVTVCTWGRECLFGEIVDGEMRLNECGEIVAGTWKWLGEQYPYVFLDEWIVMPNHLHGIITIVDEASRRRGGSRTAPTMGAASNRKPLGRLIGAFKTVSSRRINEFRGNPGAPVWQRNYYEHVIRSEESLDEIRQYIAGNPVRWAEDEENPENISSKR